MMAKNSGPNTIPCEHLCLDFLTKELYLASRESHQVQRLFVSGASGYSKLKTL